MSAQQKKLLQESAPATLYHMTHIDNLASILEHGLHSHDNNYQSQDISNQQVNARRGKKEPIYHRSIHSYVPLYFNPRNAMLYKTQMQYGGNIVILGFDAEILLQENTLFSSGNAAANDTDFSNDLNDLDKLNWNLIFSHSWNGYGEHVKKIMMSEALVYQHLSMNRLQDIHCSNTFTQKMVNNIVKQADKNFAVTTDQSLYFENLL